MVTRRTRNYKEKKPMATFGQFILPLTVIMAVALLFFSVKLFFFSPNGSDDIVFSKQEQVAQDSAQAKPEVKGTNKDTSVPAAGKKVDIKQAQPVDVKNEEQQKKAPAETVSAKTTAKPAAAVKETTQQSQKVQPATVIAPRWDVQIGAFSSKENALQLIEKVKEKGYTAYLTEGNDKGAPFYKVRVKNPKTGKDEADALSKRLEKDGYPFCLVERN